MEDDDPALGEKFSTATLRNDIGAGPIPSTVHGAPSTAAESREVLARLKRMAGFESQDFDPAVRPPYYLPPGHQWPSPASHCLVLRMRLQRNSCGRQACMHACNRSRPFCHHSISVVKCQ